MKFSIRKSYIFFVIIFLLIVFIPWQDLRNSLYLDRQVNIDYMYSGLNRIEYLSYENIFDFWKNEYFWDYLIQKALYFGILPEVYLNVIAMLSLLSALFLLQNKNKIYYSIFLINPIYIDFLYSQSRLALAMSMFTIFLLNYKKNIYYLLLIMSFFIHSSIALIFLIFILSIFVSKAKISFFQIFLILFFGFILSVVLGPLRYNILSFVGDRRATYSDMSDSFSYLSFWLMLYVFLNIYIYIKKKIIYDYFKLFGFLILSLVFFIALSKGYSSRFIALGLPFIFLLISDLDSEYRLFILGFYVIFTIVAWTYWIGW